MKRTYLIPIFLIYFLSLVFVSPFFEYPIGDDWSYSKAMSHLYEIGEIKIPWTGQSLIVQMAWAFLFLLPFGFSFSALHLSTTVMGAFTILFFDQFIEILGFDKRERCWGCLLLVISPMFIFSSRTFYTELPFLTFYLAAAWAYGKGLLCRSGRWFLIGGFFLSLSVLVRQVAIFFPLALLCVLWKDRKDFSSRQFLGVGIPFFTLGVFTLWRYVSLHGMSNFDILWLTYALRLDKILLDFIRIPFFALLYFGYYLSPLLVPCALGLFEKRNTAPVYWRLILLGCLAFGIVILILGRGQGLWMPNYFPRGFTLQGTGPLPRAIMTLLGVIGAATLAAVYYPHTMVHLETRRIRGAIRGVLILLLCIILVLSVPAIRASVLSLASSLLPSVYHFFLERIHLYQALETWQLRLPLLYHRMLLSLWGILCLGGLLFLKIPFLTKGVGRENISLSAIEKPEVVLHITSLLYFLFLLFFTVTTDRYLFPIFPSAILLVLRLSRLVPTRRFLSSSLIFFVFIPSLLYADRTIQRVGALWEGGHWLIRQGIPPEKINAGYVFNSWHLYEKRQEEGFEKSEKGWREEGWWVTHPLYQVSIHPRQNDEILRQIPYRDLFTPSMDFVYVSRRK